MPFPFELPTTGSVNLSQFFTSRTHPSLLLVATSRRSILKDVLKRHKRLPKPDRAAHLSAIDDAIHAYLPYVLLLGDTQEQRSLGVDVQNTRPLQVEWRSTLSATLPGREPARPKVAGVQYEVVFTLLTLAYVRALLSRSQLRALQDGTVLSAEQRTGCIIAANKYLLEACSILKFILTLPSAALTGEGPIDTQAATITGLASLLLAEANLVFIAKDDPYAAAVAADRDDSNTDWMYKAVSIPKVRASLYARICVAAAEHAAAAQASFTNSGKVNDSMIKYANDLRRTARAKAIRLLAVNAEAAGNTGEALAWLNAAKKELGIATDAEAGKRKGFRGLKQSWQERREDRKVEKGSEWGLDAGRLEEARVVEMLDAKWDKENSTINVQAIPPFEPLLRQLPSGRDPHTPQPWSSPVLDTTDLTTLRAPVESADLYQAEEEDSGAEELYTRMPKLSVGGFPDAEAPKGSTGSYY